MNIAFFIWGVNTTPENGRVKTLSKVCLDSFVLRDYYKPIDTVGKYLV